jgi:hypothetical protein
MAGCLHCGSALPGRVKVCDACKSSKRQSRKGLGTSLRSGEAISIATPVGKVEVSADGFPTGLHTRGRQLWAALGQSLDSAAGQLALEACRTADRLDELDNVIAGKGVLNLLQFRTQDNRTWWDSDGTEHVHITVTFQGVLAEARQQQVAFKALLTGLETKGAATQPTEEGSPLAQVLALVHSGPQPAGRPS